MDPDIRRDDDEGSDRPLEQRLHFVHSPAGHSAVRLAGRPGVLDACVPIPPA